MRFNAMRRQGFTLAEMMTVVAISGILAGVAVPAGYNAVRRAQEETLRRDLLSARSSVRQFFTDTSCFPSQISDLALPSSPSTGLNRDGSPCTISSANWRGPYVVIAPIDAVAATPFTYVTAPSGNSKTGTVASSAGGNDSAGLAFSTY